jgi:hypothetical protein
VAHETAGKRLYQIRLALGDGSRSPEAMAAFADRVERLTGRRYDPSTISLLERDKQGWRIVDIRAFASVDPLKRGAAWLSALDQEPPEIELPDPTKDRKLSTQEAQRAVRAAELERREQSRSPAKKKRKRSGGERA